MNVVHRIRAQRRADPEQGFTLIEIVVALAILAIIMTPLCISFITMLQRSRDVEDQLSRTGDAQRIGAAWTKDVQSVDLGGINSSGTCPDPGGAQPQEVHLVSFSWDTSSSAGTTKKTASWVAVGTGTTMKLVRRYCENDAPKLETILASRLGKDGASVADVISGPNPAIPHDYCPAVDKDPGAGVAMVSDTCTLVIKGVFPYRLSVSRRVPEVGVSTSPATAPPAPTITATSGRNTYITVVWTPPSSWTPPIDGFRAFAYTSPTGGQVATAQVDGASNSADLTGLTNGTDYWVRVQSHNSVGWGELSPAFGPTKPQPTAPDEPTITNVVAGDTSATVFWTPNANDGGSAVTEWLIWATSGGTTIGPAHIAGGGATSGDITGLTNASSYTFVVAGVNTIGEGLHSDPSGAEVPYGIPGVARNVTATPLSDGKVRITWAAPNVNPPNSSAPDGGRPILGYRVRVTAGGSAGPWPDASTLTAAAATTLDATGLTLGTNYTFVVETYNARGHSVSASVSSLARALPGAPPGVSVTATGAGELKVSWSAAAANGTPITGYTVTRTGTGSPTTMTTSSTTVTFTGLSAGTSYTFTVTAQNAAGTGPSSSVSGTATGLPSAPTGVTLSRPAGSFGRTLSVSFGAPTNTGGVPASSLSYSVTCTAPSGTTATRSFATAGTWTVTGSDVRDGRNYSCSVAAVNATFGAGPSTSNAGTVMPYGECTMQAGEDTWINSSATGTNYHTDTRLVVSPSSRKWAMLRFNLAGGTGSCTNAGNQAFPSTAHITSGTMGLYMYAHDVACCWPFGVNAEIQVSTISANWVATSATWSNTGSKSSPGAINNIGDEDGAKTWPVDSTLLNNLKSGTNTGLILTADGGYNRMRDMSFYSVNSTATPENKPRLTMTFYTQGA